MSHLSDAGIRALEVPVTGQKDYYDEGGPPGFGLRVSAHGARSFFVYLGKNGSRRRKTIGRYGIITLAQARGKAKELLAKQTLGLNQSKTITFSEAMKTFEAQWYPRLKPRTVKDYTGIFSRHYSPKLGKSKLSEMETEEVTNITDKLVKTPTEQRHALVVGGTFFRWCVRRKYMKHNPLEGIDVPKPRKRKRVLSDDELVRIFRAADVFPEPFRSIVLLLILTGQRRGEIAGLHKLWFSHNEQALKFPAEFTKNKREHILPLGPMALSILGSVSPEGFYFPAGDGETCFSAFSKNKKALDEATGEMEPWSLHTLRHTFSTNCARWGVAPHIKEMLLNHVSSRSEVEALYDHHKYEVEKRQAMLTIEDNIKRLLEAHHA